MLDNLSIKIIKWPLAQSAKLIDKCGVTANQTTLFGFALGCFALPALVAEQYTLALAFILLNRICDGLDGALARIQGITDAGGFLDIKLRLLVLFSDSIWLCTSKPRTECRCGRVLDLLVYWNRKQLLSICDHGG